MDHAPPKDATGLSMPDAQPPPEERMAELRRLLLGPFQQQLDGVERRLDAAKVKAEEVSAVLPEAVAMGAARDRKLALALEPITASAIKNSIRKNRQVLVDAVFPLMGPAIRKAIAATLQGMLQSFNQILENSLSLRGLKWRLEALRTRRSFAEVVLLHTMVYQVEQVFLIHRRTGLLLQSATAKSVVAQDPDLISGMLTAIQDFVHDSFGAGADANLETLRVGEQNVWIEQGEHAVLAAVIRGNPPADLQQQLRDALDEIRFKLGQELRSFEGDAAPFAAGRYILENCLQIQFRSADRKTSLLPLVLLSLVLVLAGSLGYWLYRGHARWSGLVSDLRRQPGIVVTSAIKEDGRFRIAGLRDPLAPDPALLLQAAGIDAADVDFQWEPYQSPYPPYADRRLRQILMPPATVSYRFEDGIVRLAGTAMDAWLLETERLAGLLPWIGGLDSGGLVTVEGALQPPPQVRISLEGTTLVIAGEAPHDWIAAARERAAGLPGVSRVVTEGLKDLELMRFEDLRRGIENGSVTFTSGRSYLETEQLATVRRLARDLKQMLVLAAVLKTKLTVDIVGRTDPPGSEEFNVTLSRERAEAVRAALIGGGVPADVLTYRGVGSRPHAGVGTDAEQRCVTFHVNLEPESAGGS